MRGKASVARLGRAALWLAVAWMALPAQAQDWFRTGTGLGVEKARLAVADFTPRNEEARPLARVFSDVLYADLEFSGILEMVSKSFYPLKQPSIPLELNHLEWSEPPAQAHMLTFGNVLTRDKELLVEAWVYDVRNAASPPALAKRYRSEATEAGARLLAHMLADDIVSLLSGGVPGVAQTQIAYISGRSGAKELWAMDYDGANQRRLTGLGSSSTALTPRWSPDALRIAFTCYIETHNRPRTAQICMYSMEAGRLIAFPTFNGTNSAPAFSPDGSHIMFSSSMYGDMELFTMDPNGRNVKRITYSNGVDTSPVWNPKTGQQVAFVSDRGGRPHLYIMNADGSNAERLSLLDMGYVIDPTWSPNGQLLAFSYQRSHSNYDIYVMDIASRELFQLTRDVGRNERPSWAPDGRHIVFESTRTGRRQIWSMLADGTQARQLTFDGVNESPNWSPR